MKKYAMIPINYRYEDDGIHIRRVLISYLFKITRRGISTYYFTKFICSDAYFNSKEATHKYRFSDKYYRLIRVDNSIREFEYSFKKPTVFLKRRYHSRINSEKDITSVEFKSITEQIAIDKFKSRKELK